MADLSMSDLRKKYNNFYAPAFDIKIKGKNVVKDLGAGVPSINVSLSCGFDASSCSFEVNDLYNIEQRKFKDGMLDNYFLLGNVVEVSVGYIKTEMIFMGLISTISFSYGSDGAPSISVECLDIKSRMMADKLSKEFKERKFTEVAEKVINQYKSYKAFNQVKVDPLEGEEEKETIEKQGESDYNLLRRIAETIGYEFYVEKGDVYFRDSMKDTSTLIELEFGSDIESFRTSRNLVGQVHSVTAKNTSEDTTEVIKYTAFASNLGKGKKKTASDEAKISKGVEKVIVDPKINKTEDAKKVAEAELEDLCMGYVRCNGACVGFPEFLPGRFINLTKLGLNKSNKDTFYVIKVEHSISSSGYQVSFEGRMPTVEL